MLSLLPAPRAFIVLRIDAVATLASLDDPIATAAARELASRSRKYVGYVSQVIEAFDWKVAYHTYAVCLSSPGLAPHNEEMYTPVKSSSCSSIPPWATRVQPSSARALVRVPVKLADDSEAVFLSPEEGMRHRRALSRVDPLADYGCFFTGGEGEDTVPVVVDVSYDLAEVPEIPDARGFFEEREQLERLAAESWARRNTVCRAPSTPTPIPTPKIQIELVSDIPPASFNEDAKAPGGPHRCTAYINPGRLRPDSDSEWRISAFVYPLPRSIRSIVSSIRDQARRFKDAGVNVLRTWTMLMGGVRLFSPCSPIC